MLPKRIAPLFALKIKKTKKIERRSNITVTKGGNPLPKLRKGAKYTKALAVAQDTALADEEPSKDEETGVVYPPRLPKGAWEKTIKSLKPEDIDKKAFKGLKKPVIIKVPKKCIKSYEKMFRKKGLSKKVQIKKL